MPRIVDCEEANCHLKTPGGMDSKFCQECGCSAASKVVITKDACKACGSELEDTARFCPECGGKVERSRVAALLAGHQRPGEVKTGRGLSEAELAQMEETIRKPSRVTDPVGTYVDPDEMAAHLKESGLEVPDDTDLEVQLSKGRTAIKNLDGEHKAGGLSAESKVPKDYASGVRVIPYKFKNAARRGPTTVQDSRGGSKGSGPDISASEAESFFQDEPEGEVDPFFSDEPAPPPKTKRAKKASAAEKKAAIAAAGPPKEPVKCHECGRFLNDEGDCAHCVVDEMSEAELEGLWDTGPS
jgi:hypothetical protein